MPATTSTHRPIRLVALDLDGTILEPGGTISGEVLGALTRLRARDVACVTATGRPLDFQLALLDRHDIGPAVGLFSALIADEREIHLRDDRNAPAPAYRPHPKWNDEIRLRWDHLVDEAMGWLDRATAEAAGRGWSAQTYPLDVIARRGLATVALENADHATAIRRWLSDQLSAAGSELVCNQNVRLVQVVDGRAGKGHVLATLADLLGVARDQVLAIGDSANDHSMLDGSFGFRAAAPANADPETQAAVRRGTGYVARGPIGAGVVEALEALCPPAP